VWKKGLQFLPKRKKIEERGNGRRWNVSKENKKKRDAGRKSGKSGIANKRSNKLNGVLKENVKHVERN